VSARVCRSLSRVVVVTVVSSRNCESVWRTTSVRERPQTRRDQLRVVRGLGWPMGQSADGLGWVGSHKMDPSTTLDQLTDVDKMTVMTYLERWACSDTLPTLGDSWCQHWQYRQRHSYTTDIPHYYYYYYCCSILVHTGHTGDPGHAANTDTYLRPAQHRHNIPRSC